MTRTIRVDNNDAREMSDRAIGWMIAAATAVAVLMMAHHPTIEADAMADVVVEMTRESGINGVVHGVLIALLGVLMFAFAEYARRPGHGTLLLRAALLAYTVGALASIGAGLVNGFVAPDLALRYRGADPAALDALRHLLRLSWRINQALEQLGEVARGLAIVLWSIGLYRSSGLRGFAVFGIAAGAVPALAVVTGLLPLHLTGAWLALAPGALWNFVLAVLLIRGRLRQAR